LLVTAVDLLVLCRGVSLRSEISRCRAGAGEEPSEDWLDDGSEDDLGAIGHWKSHPQDEDELEDIVEWEPVDCVDQAFKDIQEGVNNPVCQPLSVVDLVRTEQSVQGIVAGKDKTGDDKASEEGSEDGAGVDTEDDTTDEDSEEEDSEEDESSEGDEDTKELMRELEKIKNKSQPPPSKNNNYNNSKENKYQYVITVQCLV